jgi:alkylation response protein AidB-like acyl-CoA dehydrogenase
MYNLHLSPEQLEIRDTVRDFGAQKIKPILLDSQRLDARDRRLPKGLLYQASRIGMRTLALSEAVGGAGADHLTCCLVAEELAACDADFAATLAETSSLGHILFDQVMTDDQRERFLPKFLEDDDFHLAAVSNEGSARLGIHYHRPSSDATVPMISATKAGSDWIINGTADCVTNAPIAGLFAVLVTMLGRADAVALLVPAGAPGVTVRAHENAWRHGVSGAVKFTDCRVPGDNVLGDNATALLNHEAAAGRGIPLASAINLGIARAAYDAALDYARLRVQGGRPIIEHQAIGTKLAEIAIKLEVARAAIWGAAWASDHPSAYADGSLSDLPLQTIAQVFVSETLLKAVRDAAELFGAMGVMRDMPLQKYVHDALVCVHGLESNSDAKLRIAEGLSGYRRRRDGTQVTAAEWAGKS